MQLEPRESISASGMLSQQNSRSVVLWQCALLNIPYKVLIHGCFLYTKLSYMCNGTLSNLASQTYKITSCAAHFLKMKVVLTIESQGSDGTVFIYRMIVELEQLSMFRYQMSSCVVLMATVIMLASHQPLDIWVNFFLMQQCFIKHVMVPFSFTKMKCSECLQLRKHQLLLIRSQNLVEIVAVCSDINFKYMLRSPNFSFDLTTFDLSVRQ